MLRTDEQNARKDIEYHDRKLKKIYAEFPEFKRVDTIETVIKIDNPVTKFDTVILYKDLVIKEKVYRRIVQKCKDSALAKEIANKIVENYRCIKDSIVIKDTLFKAIITQDSLGVHVSINPNDTSLTAKYKIPCPEPVLSKEKSFWEYEEFWFLAILFILTILAIIIHLRLQK
jgi:hypothetical protein